MLRPHHILALCVLCLLMLGVIMVNSADMGVTRVSLEQPVHQTPTILDMLSSRPALYALIALAGMGAIALFLPVRRLAAFAESVRAHGRPEGDRPALMGLFVGTALLMGFCALVYMPGLEREVNGSHRWVNIPGVGEALSFQPSEVAKWGLIALIAWYCTRRAAMVDTFWKGLVPALLAIGVVAGFIVLEDLGTGVLIAGVAALVLLAGGAKPLHFLALTPAPIAGVVAAIATSDYRMARIMAFMNPYADPEGIGYHTVQSLTAIANGEVTGRGLGGSIQKLGYLPEDRTDFIFAVLCEELGLPGAALVVLLFAALVWAGLLIMHRERQPLLRLMTLGILATVGLQACINLLVVTAMAPTKGIALPLISNGGTGWILTACSLGVVMAIARSQPEHESVPRPVPADPSPAAPSPA